jgi:hypothetical protein
MGFEPTIPAGEHVKTVHALDRAATVICVSIMYYYKLFPSFSVPLAIMHPFFRPSTEIHELSRCRDGLWSGRPGFDSRQG